MAIVRYSHDTTATIKPSLSCIASWNRRLRREYNNYNNNNYYYYVVACRSTLRGVLHTRTHAHYTSVSKYSRICEFFGIFNFLINYYFRRSVTCQLCASRRPRRQRWWALARRWNCGSDNNKVDTRNIIIFYTIVYGFADRKWAVPIYDRNDRKNVR